ncbi:4-galactosyl-N-acetylglucosaminide 3-alpha-L-fucosyltransferase FUT6-like [Styela clava]|uniref:4-galactosyl-N-acetylglucosaminide 3-alpha-L-fucosyltransferase FUT6-like n=1 Tax=Styela clava TaxID=7725 RepID=UPI00193A2675|nr:4-galactosyl-N-acetylglucosaminide 3-alpha-L-fucosyltransferase FUT6-like [Styela clava]
MLRNQHGRSASFKITTVVLFTTAVFTLSTLEHLRRTSFQNESLQETAPDGNMEDLGKMHAAKLENYVPLPEDADYFPLPIPHMTYVKAVGTVNSKKLVEERTKLGFYSPKILIWRGLKDVEGGGTKNMNFVLSRQCGGCQVTNDRSVLEESIAVLLFNDIGLKEMDIPDRSTRRNDQVYVLWTRETPSKTFTFKHYLENPAYDGIFNLTFYFRRDSDVRHYFGNSELALRISKSFQERYGWNEYLESKSREALWFVSNCDHTNGAMQRMEYAKKLVEAGLNLDKFGKCFSNDNIRTDSKQIPEFAYRFYLSFENSIHCPDYITEKFWRNALQTGIVPVVWGPTKADVEAVAPPNSFIHSDDFKSPEDLVVYLKYLSNNHTAYMKYHEWRKAEIDVSIPEEDIAKGHEASFCRLCKRQILEKHPPKSIASVSKLLYETKYVDKKCLVHKPSPEERKKSYNF